MIAVARGGRPGRNVRRRDARGCCGLACGCACTYHVHMKTARLTVLLDPAEKRTLEARAAALSLSTSELVRRAVDVYEPDADTGALGLVAAEFAAAVARVEAKLDALERRLEREALTAADRAEVVASVRREAASEGTRWPFAVPGW